MVVQVMTLMETCLYHTCGQTAGAHNVTLIGANTANATFTAPNVSSSGDILTFSLNVTDAKGLASSSPLDSMSVTVNDNPQLNNPPQTLDQTVSTNKNAAVEIAFTGSDSDGDTLSFYTVTQPRFGSLGPITATGPNSTNVTYNPNSDYVGQDSYGSWMKRYLRQSELESMISYWMAFRQS